MHVLLTGKATSADRAEKTFIKALAAKLNFVVPEKCARNIHVPLLHETAYIACIYCLDSSLQSQPRSIHAPDAWDELASCFAKAAARYASDNNGRPPVLVIDGAELLMVNTPFVDALLTTFKVGSEP